MAPFTPGGGALGTARMYGSFLAGLFSAGLAILFFRALETSNAASGRARTEGARPGSAASAAGTSSTAATAMEITKRTEDLPVSGTVSWA